MKIVATTSRIIYMIFILLSLQTISIHEFRKCRETKRKSCFCFAPKHRQLNRPHKKEEKTQSKTEKIRKNALSSVNLNRPFLLNRNSCKFVSIYFALFLYVLFLILLFSFFVVVIFSICSNCVFRFCCSSSLLFFITRLNTSKGTDSP